jgi:hypothetical protein
MQTLAGTPGPPIRGANAGLIGRHIHPNLVMAETPSEATDSDAVQPDTKRESEQM